MIPNRPFRAKPVTARDRLLEAAVKLIRLQGFAATSVDELCRAAGVTKGAFFHHFASKEALGVATADYWSQSTGGFFAEAPYHHLADPLDRVFAYIDLRSALINGPIEDFTCVAGTMVRELFVTSPAIRDACGGSITANAAALEVDIAAAMVLHGVTGTTATSLGLHMQAVLQGAFILAKSGGGAALAREQLAHLRRYFELLFNKENHDAR